MTTLQRGSVGEADLDARVLAIERPHPSLLKLYVLTAAVTLFAFPFVMLPLWFRYHTLRYRFDDEGVRASWGILFKREVLVSYRRIQDIHVSRNVVERWLGIGTVEIQTASGSSSAELKLEGMEDHEAVRDFLYARMRGARDPHGARAQSGAPPAAAGAPAAQAESVALLREIRAELDAVRRALEARAPERRS